MEFDFGIRHLKFKERKGMLLKDSVGVVKCKKAFPIYDIDGRVELFKPLSKTKPWSTPFFAISEVFWSTIINQFFDKSAPIYKLAICDGYEKEYPSRFSKGVLVPSIIKEDEELLNLLEYYRAHPCDSVNIDKYENFCGQYYDYTSILNSPVFQDNRALGSSLAHQILLSLLKNDLNFHYENVAFITKSGQITSLAPPIDHEFSLPFLFPEGDMLSWIYGKGYFDTLINKRESTNGINLEAVIANINLIKEKYPDVSGRFVSELMTFIEAIRRTKLRLPRDYIDPCHSYLFQKYEAIYHEHKDMPIDDSVQDISPVETNVDLIELQVMADAEANATALIKALGK